MGDIYTLIVCANLHYCLNNWDMSGCTSSIKINIEKTSKVKSILRRHQNTLKKLRSLKALSIDDSCSTPFNLSKTQIFHSNSFTTTSSLIRKYYTNERHKKTPHTHVRLLNVTCLPQCIYSHFDCCVFVFNLIRYVRNKFTQAYDKSSTESNSKGCNESADFTK